MLAVYFLSSSTIHIIEYGARPVLGCRSSSGCFPDATEYLGYLNIIEYGLPRSRSSFGCLATLHADQKQFKTPTILSADWIGIFLCLLFLERTIRDNDNNAVKKKEREIRLG